MDSGTIKNPFYYALEAAENGSMFTCPNCGQWVDALTHNSTRCFNQEDVIDVTRWGDKERQGIDKYGDHYVRGKVSKQWIRRPKTDYELAMEELDAEFPDRTMEG